MKHFRITIYMLIMALCLVLGGCVSTLPVEKSTTEDTSQQQSAPVLKAAVTDINDLPLVDDASLYHEYNPVSLVHFYITVRYGNAADGTNHTFEEVNSYSNLQGMTGVEKIKTEIIFQAGDENGPLPGEIGYNASQPNATLNVRGRTSTLRPQKSYRIDLFENAGLWRGQKAIALNKHVGDPTRVRNMLYFTLMQGIPDLTSLRTQFVQVYIKDETKAESDAAFVDYGLFTQVEVPNGRFLRNHSLSRNGNLYKAEISEMYRYADKIRLATDPGYDLEQFSTVFEPKTSEDHTKLITMLDAVNDYSVPIEDVIQQYFDANNLASFLAFNILTANLDSSSQNYLLYSPVNSSKWYYLLWDGDGSMAYYANDLLGNTWAQAEWMRGVSNYWGVVLFNRMLRVPQYRQLLVQKVEQIRETITPERIEQLIKQFRTVVDPFTRRMPDVIHLGSTLEQLELIYQNMPNDTELAYQNFLGSLKKPMPFFLDDVDESDDSLLLQWGEAYDFGGELVYYTLEVASDWSFKPESLVYTGNSRQLMPEAEIPALPEGTYYWRIIATNESGYEQLAFDQVVTDSGSHFGIRRFSITKDGEVNNSQ